MNKIALAKRWQTNLSELLGLPGKVVPDHERLSNELSSILDGYLDEAEVADIYNATLYGAKAHQGQKRASGEDYICHPIAVACILGEMRMDSRTIIAAILHDVVEDTSIALSQLAESFGNDVATMVDGVSKVSHILPRQNTEAKSFHKMFIAAEKDPRVIIIKLADRLHNMRTLESLDDTRKRRIARQTLDIYAPMADRLGMRELCQNLEDLSLLNLYPMRYHAIAKNVVASKSGRKSVVSEACKNIQQKLEQNGLTAEVHGREKNIYNIYRKMRRKKLAFKDVKDINAIRIITEKRPSCYHALGIIHQLYHPRPGSFKDYIAIPKSNGYQSLHTVVVGPFGQLVEVQIRSRAMHRTAEKGVASHWLYKTSTTGEHAPQQFVSKWLKRSLESQHISSDSSDYIEHLKADLSPDDVLVFTPKGETKRLPRSATALDFAYAVHSDVGDHCVGALINQSGVPLHEKLSNGDVVEVKTSRTARPIPQWLDYAVTSQARASIRHYIKQKKDKESIRLGRKLLRGALSVQGYRRVRIPGADKDRLLAHLKLDSWEQLLVDVGFGKRLPALVAKQLIAKSATQHHDNDLAPKDQKHLTTTIEGTEGLLITYAFCCHPIPGEKIIGTMTSSEGLVVHRANCKQCKVIMRKPDQCLYLNWSKTTKGNFQTVINIKTRNKPGVLKSISDIIFVHNCNIKTATVGADLQHTSNMLLTLEVTDRKHLAAIMRQLRADASVIKLNRG